MKVSIDNTGSSSSIAGATPCTRNFRSNRSQSLQSAENEAYAEDILVELLNIDAASAYELRHTFAGHEGLIGIQEVIAPIVRKLARE